MSRLAPSHGAPAIESLTSVSEPCDSDCPADAAFEITVSLTLRFYLCGHHYHENQLAIFERGYEVKELS